MAGHYIFFPFASDQMDGAIAVNVFAILSALALFSIVARAIWLGVRCMLHQNIGDTRECIFFNTQLGYYAACLLLANMFNSVAGLMGLPAVVKHGIQQDALCITQATMMQFGNITTAYYTVAIALHTFNSLVIRKRQSAIVYTVAISLGWIVGAVIATLPLYISQPYGAIYGVSGLSCGVRDVYAKHQFLLHLLPIFVTAFISAVSYALIFLVLRGTVVVKGGVKFRLDPKERWSARVDNYHRFIFGIARSMCWYPVAYILLLVPYSVTRLLVLSGYAVPFQAMVFAFVFWFLLGIVNVLLLYNTFRVLGPAFDGRMCAQRSGTSNDIESFHSTEKLAQGANHTHHGSWTMYNAPSPTPSSAGSSIGPPVSPQMASPAIPPRSASLSPARPYVGQNIAPPEVLDRMLTPEPLRSQSRTLHSRDNSSGSSTGLPVPPRPMRPLMTARQASLERLSPINTSLAAQSSRASVRLSTSERNSSGSQSFQDLDITGWLAQQAPDGSMPSGIKNRPLLSAVTPAFPLRETSPVSPAGSPSRLRPLVLSSRSPTQSPTKDMRFGTNPRGSPRPLDHARGGSGSSATFF